MRNHAKAWLRITEPKRMSFELQSLHTLRVVCLWSAEFFHLPHMVGVTRVKEWNRKYWCQWQCCQPTCALFFEVGKEFATPAMALRIGFKHEPRFSFRVASRRGVPYMTSAVGGGGGPPKADKRNKISWFVTVTRGRGGQKNYTGNRLVHVAPFQDQNMY